ncbi:primosomal protein N' [Parafrigoribacterium mesophilum]|uniref:primosomal protein N' family DNA-binding protein n=1 Tax=Parafrigoribacterium mesophilum TaxID=433646 RepID=UPI0031FCB1DD
MPAASIARVLLDSPLPQLDRLFDYRIPPQFAQEAMPGVRVRVPLRSAGRLADGFLIDVAQEAEYSGVLSELDSVVSPVPVLAPEVWALARSVADRAAGGASDVLRLAVPKRQVRVEKAWLEHPDDTAFPVHPIDLPDYDTAVFDAAIADGGRLAVEALPLLAGLPDGPWVGHWAVTLAALATRALGHGSVILAVPDYRDQDQLVAALEAVLPAEAIVRLDARQSNPDRYRGMLACLGDTPRVIVGNRSVIYAPARQLALIGVWDDGDPLHAEPLAPYVHTRDAALVRTQQQHCALVFLAHSRSVEVQRLVTLRWLQPIGPRRAYSPRVIPTAGQSSDAPAQRARIPSTAWREAKAALEFGPVLVQVARPGYAPKLVCASCHQDARCARCSGPLTMKSAHSRPTCRWCGAIAAQWRCPVCEGTDLRLVGQGTARTAEDLGRAFPGVRVILADGDHPVRSVDAEPALIVATRGAEPIAPGGYRAVLLLDGENMVARESLRVGEDCLRWWSNAIALAAISAPCVLVGVGGALASALATWRLPDYAASELQDRRRLRFPPAVRVATLTGSADVVADAVAKATQIGRTDVLGPTDTDDGVRAILRFDYADGGAVAAVLRAEVIVAATRRRKLAAGGDRATLPSLRVRCDDPEPFLE